MARKVKPEQIVVLGDFLDCYSVSDYSRDPSRIGNLLKETSSARLAIKELEALNAKKYIFIEGNHEDRVRRYIETKAPELQGITSTQQLLGLQKWKFVSYKSFTTIGKVNITHDVGHAGQYAAAATLNAFQDNVVFGHTHRGAVIYAGTVSGNTHVCLNAGWGGDVTKIDYMHQAKAVRDWTLGFGLGYLEPCGAMHCQFVPMVKYKCVVDGTLFKG